MPDSMTARDTTESEIRAFIQHIEATAQKIGFGRGAHCHVSVWSNTVAVSLFGNGRTIQGVGDTFAAARAAFERNLADLPHPYTAAEVAATLGCEPEVVNG